MYIESNPNRSFKPWKIVLKRKMVIMWTTY